MKAATCNPAAHKIPERISIHAAREGGDLLALFSLSAHSRFQSTPPVKAATMADFNKRLDNEFQSTPPVKAATLHHPRFARASAISIHAAREGGDILLRMWTIRIEISIHAAREGGDCTLAGGLLKFYAFQSTPPVKAATQPTC